MAKKDEDELEDYAKQFKAFGSQLKEDLTRGQIKNGKPPSLQGMLKNAGKEAQSFFSGPNAQADSRREGQAARDKALQAYDQNKRVADNKAAGGSSMSNTVMDTAVAGLETVSNAKPKVDVIDYTDAPMEGPKPEVIDYTNAPVEGPQNQKAQSFLDKRYSPQKMGGTATFIGDKKFKREARNRETRAQNFFAQNQQLEARKEFAADLYKNKFNPETASDENRKNYFERGESMGLTPQQMDKYTQSYLNPDAPEPATQGGSGQGRMPTQDASPQVKQTAAGIVDTKDDGGPVLKTGGLGEKRLIGTEADRLRRKARQARRDGQPQVEKELYRASVASDLNTPAIRSQEYNYAQGQRKAQLASDEAAGEAMKRKVIQDIMNRERRDDEELTNPNAAFKATQYYPSS